MMYDQMIIGGYYRHRYKEYGSDEEKVHDFRVSQIREHDGRLYVWCKESGCVCAVTQAEPIPLTTSILEQDGWETKDNIVWYKKGPVRLGWYEKKAELIIGYHTMPIVVEFVHTLQNVIRLLGMEDDIKV